MTNRRNRRKPGANKRKDDRRLLLDGEEPDEQTYLSVTSADIRTWFRNLSTGQRGSRSRGLPNPAHYHHTDTFS